MYALLLVNYTSIKKLKTKVQGTNILAHSPLNAKKKKKKNYQVYIMFIRVFVNL